MRRLLAVFIPILLAGCGSSAPAPVADPEPSVMTKLPAGTHQQIVDVPDLGPVRYTVTVPSGYDDKTPVPLVLALHFGYPGQQPAPFTGRAVVEAFRPGLAALNAVVIAPDALGGRWTDPHNEQAAVWLTKTAMTVYAIDPKRVVVTGFSLGGEGAWHIGSRHQDLFTGVVPVAGRVAGGDAEWKVPVYVIHSEKDEVVPYGPAKARAEALKAKGAKVEFKTVTDLTHYRTADYGPHVGDAVTWLQVEWK